MEMLDYWTEQYPQSPSSSDILLPDAREDILKFALNVILSAGFGVKLPFKPASEATAADTKALFKDAESPPPGYHFTFRAVNEYMNHKISSVFMANRLLPQWIPRSLLPFYETAFAAHEDLGKYLRALVTSGEVTETRAVNLLEGMVQNRTKDEEDKGLTESEILGNLYIFTIAGHETTATTLRFALVLLALHPEVQDAICEEVQAVTREESTDPTQWDYNTVFPKLVTPLCVMVRYLS